MHRNDLFAPLESTNYARAFIDPLTSVRTVTELLRDYPDLDNGQQRLFLKLILNSTDRLIDLVDGIVGAEPKTAF